MEDITISVDPIDVLMSSCPAIEDEDDDPKSCDDSDQYQLVYTCGVCQKRFKYHANILKHMKNEHFRRKASKQDSSMRNSNMEAQQNNQVGMDNANFGMVGNDVNGQLINREHGQEANTSQPNKRLSDAQKRHSSKEPCITPSCGHTYGSYQCRMVTPEDAMEFNRRFYAQENKVGQDNFIITYCSRNISKNTTSRGKRKKNDLPVKYYISKYNAPNTVTPVCKDFFCKVLSIGRYRVIGVLGRFLKNGTTKEQRGGDRKGKLYDVKREAVMSYLKEYKTKPEYHEQIHKKKNSKLSVRKIWQTYNKDADNDLKVAKSFFYGIFNNYFSQEFATTDNLHTSGVEKKQTTPSKPKPADSINTVGNYSHLPANFGHNAGIYSHPFSNFVQPHWSTR